MNRTVRPPFHFPGNFDGLAGEAQNRLLFDWWCDDGDRKALLETLRGRPLVFKSRAPRQDDPAPPLGTPAPQGFRTAWILSSRADIDLALRDGEQFSNIPYATLGGGGFVLAQDPAHRDGHHAAQVAFIHEAIRLYDATALRGLAARAVEQAALTALARPDFDLALLAEQAGLRYFGLLFGYGFADHALLEDASRAAYGALQYIAIGQHFATEPGTVQAAQQAVGGLVARTSALSDEYARLARAPRRFGPANARNWPTGVQPWNEGETSALGKPLLARLNEIDDSLSGRDRAIVCAMLVAGTLGNVQTAVCLLVRDLLNARDDELAAVKACDDDSLEKALAIRLGGFRPVPVLPRRARCDVRLADGRTVVAAGDDCLVALEGAALAGFQDRTDACPHAWGQASDGRALHPCLGKALAEPLIAAIVKRVVALPGLTQALDPLTGEALEPERLWGFACQSYPLRHDRLRTKIQQNLIVSMPIKAPVAENAVRLRRLLASAAPRIDSVLTGFAGVHFAWFEFDDHETRLVLRTVYDGAFEAYVRHFALHAGDVFDALFESIESAPPRPVAEHPDDFVETIRRFNMAPFGGYLYTAYPGLTAFRARLASKR